MTGKIAVAFLALLAIASCEGDEMAATNYPLMDGKYDLNPAGCDDDLSTTRLTVADRKLQFYESQCRMSVEVKDATGERNLLTCSGEGESFQRRVSLVPERKGLVISEAGAIRRYHRCTI
jgi:hypothetical protein